MDEQFLLCWSSYYFVIGINKVILIYENSRDSDNFIKNSKIKKIFLISKISFEGDNKRFVLNQNFDILNVDTNNFSFNILKFKKNVDEEFLNKMWLSGHITSTIN